MYISRQCKKVLVMILGEKLDWQGLYDAHSLPDVEGMSNIEKIGCINQLINQGLLSSRDGTYFSVTEPGRNWREYARNSAVCDFKTSILCPIVVSLVTNAVIHGMPLLLKLIQGLG